MNMKKVVGRCSNSTHTKHSTEHIDLSTFEYKGCWNCRHFTREEGAFITVSEASEKHNVSKTTIRRRCKSGELDAYLCEKGRKIFQLGSNKLWLIFE